MAVRDRHFWTVLFAGGLLGLLGALLAVWGNPANSGICVSCFIENSAGSLGLHANPRMQYLRPELVGFVLGALAGALLSREFRPRGGSSPLLRLMAGVFLIIGCAVFIGCPIKLLLRLAAGDLTAPVGVAGLVAGVWLGLKALAKGVELVPAVREGWGGALLVPLIFLLLLVFLVIRPGFVQISTEGSAAQGAPWLVSLGVGLVLGALAQRSRFCITGSVRDMFLMGSRTPMVWGLAFFLVLATGASMIGGTFRFGLHGQPGAHLEHLWSFLGMGLVGWLSVLVGGCPFRQLVKAGEGDSDAGLTVVGMFLGGGIVQSWGIAAGAAGVPLAGKVAVLAGFLFLLFSCLTLRQRG